MNFPNPFGGFNCPFYRFDAKFLSDRGNQPVLFGVLCRLFLFLFWFNNYPRRLYHPHNPDAAS
jgi:hypothetical protein